MYKYEVSHITKRPESSDNKLTFTCNAEVDLKIKLLAYFYSKPFRTAILDGTLLNKDINQLLL